MREHKGKNIIALPDSYVVIDTETTGLDYDYCSLIEVSAIKYSNGSCVGVYSSLIKPPLKEVFYPFANDGAGKYAEYYVDEFIEELTGITNDMLETAPLPEEVLPKLMEFIGDSLLIGHNVNFDINFLYDAFQKTCGVPLTNNFIDTLRIARKVFPKLEHHRLSDVVQACSLSFDSAHRAEADCMATAACFEHMKQIILATTSEDEFAKSFIHRYEKQLSSIVANVDAIDETNPIFGKVVVFTGTLAAMPRKDAFQAVANLGGIPQNSVTQKTNFLVIGSAEFVQSVKEGKTNKMKQAEAYIKKGREISILSEAAFFDLISDYQN